MDEINQILDFYSCLNQKGRERFKICFDTISEYIKSISDFLISIQDMFEIDTEYLE